jgi:hypothetical protein
MRLKKEFKRRRKNYLNYNILARALTIEYINKIYNFEERD